MASAKSPAAVASRTPTRKAIEGICIIAIGSAVLVIAGWARWIAPNADHRLADPALFAAQAGLFLTVGGLMAAGGMFWVGFVFAVVATGVFALTRWGRMV